MAHDLERVRAERREAQAEWQRRREQGEKVGPDRWEIIEDGDDDAMADEPGNQDEA